MHAPNVLILRTSGTNCDEETAFAFQLAGGTPHRVHIERFLRGDESFDDYEILALPGGFAYGDYIASGKILANELVYRLREPMARFVESGKLVIGICNGFQVLVRAGLLPGSGALGEQTATLTFNDSGKFECRWVNLRSEPSKCVFTDGMSGVMTLPVAHGEGKFLTTDEELAALETNGQVVFRYATVEGDEPDYPANPNGSLQAIAGICNPSGTVLGMMPHPERYVQRTQHPRWTREKLPEDGDGLAVFRNAVDYARKHLV
ncbi:MAG: phosphoribosylformylglycinamidine synthase I [Candidatus Poribacteria bacterium]|nr:phosphoribosylformylglycinamidine synthase I [Candidatus Poribacteria bacterium]